MPSPPFRLQALLDIRRNTEAERKRAFGLASAHRAAMEVQLARLESLAAQAHTALTQAQAAQRSRPLPTRVEEGLSQVRYQDRLRHALATAQRTAQDFRDEALAHAILDEDQARQAYAEARQEHEAILKIKERDHAQWRKQADARAEDAAADLAQAAFVKNRDERS